MAARPTSAFRSLTSCLPSHRGARTARRTAISHVGQSQSAQSTGTTGLCPRIATLHTSTSTSTRDAGAAADASLFKVSPRDPPRDSPKGPAAFEGIEPVELAYDVVQPPKLKEGYEGQCMVICHGLLYVGLTHSGPRCCFSFDYKYQESSDGVADGSSGSKQNWRSLAKAFAQKLGMPIYTLVSLENPRARPCSPCSPRGCTM